MEKVFLCYVLRLFGVKKIVRNWLFKLLYLGWNCFFFYFKKIKYIEYRIQNFINVKNLVRYCICFDEKYR